MEQKLREIISSLEHEQWSHWTSYMLENLTLENVDRWKKQIKTKYEDLSEKEKDSDRKWADKVLELFIAKRKEELLSLIEEGEKIKVDCECHFSSCLCSVNNESVEHYQKIIREKLG